MYVAHPRRKIHVRIPELLHQECMRVRAPHASQCVYEHGTHPSACTSTARIPEHRSATWGQRIGARESAMAVYGTPERRRTFAATCLQNLSAPVMALHCNRHYTCSGCGSRQGQLREVLERERERRERMGESADVARRRCSGAIKPRSKYR